MSTTDTPALSPEEERELKETAWSVIDEVHAWERGDAGGPLSRVTEKIQSRLRTERLARHQAVAEERARWEPYADHRSYCDSPGQLCTCGLDELRGTTR